MRIGSDDDYLNGVRQKQVGTKCSTLRDFRPQSADRRDFSLSSMAIEPLIKRDANHRCPICGGDTELVSITLTHRNDGMQQVEVTSPRRRCANLKCKGHDDGLDNYNFADR
jgi:hypothetical protein